MVDYYNNHRNRHRVKDVLVLDDEQYRHGVFRSALSGHRVVHVHAAIEARDAMRSRRFDTVFLDHDLGDDQPTGADLADWMVREIGNHPNKPDRVVVHSLNPYGASAMYNALHRAGFDVEIVPFRSGPICA